MKKSIFLFLFFLNISYPSFSSLDNKIVVNVENQIISSYELKNKIRTILTLNNQELNQSTIDVTKNKALQNLINLKLKKNEIIKYSISPREGSVNSYLKNVSAGYNLNVEGYKKMFKDKNLDFDLYLDEITTELAWQNLIFQLYKNKVNLDEKEIDKELKEMMKKQKNMTEFNLAEIAIELEDFAKKEKIIKEVEDHLNAFGFERTAKKLSMSSTSINGGNLGWISSRSLSKKINDVVKKMDIGQISEPILQSDNLLYLKLIDKKITKSENVDIEKLRAQIVNIKKNDILDLYSNNHLSKIKNRAFIQFK